MDGDIYIYNIAMALNFELSTQALITLCMDHLSPPPKHNSCCNINRTIDYREYTYTPIIYESMTVHACCQQPDLL